jgi:hypothetical protein
MNLKALAAILMCTLSLAACKSDLKTIGTVEDDKLITPKTLADMGYNAFREKYLGQEVTVTNFYHVLMTGAYRMDSSQCKVALRTKDEESDKKFAIYIYTNHFPDFVLEDSIKNFDAKRSKYDQEVTLPAEICDEWCEYDPDTKACFYKSPDLKITGKLFEIDGGEGERTSFLYMKVKGVKY